MIYGLHFIATTTAHCVEVQHHAATFILAALCILDHRIYYFFLDAQQIQLLPKTMERPHTPITPGHAGRGAGRYTYVTLQLPLHHNKAMRVRPEKGARAGAFKYAIERLFVQAFLNSPRNEERFMRAAYVYTSSK